MTDTGLVLGGGRSRWRQALRWHLVSTTGLMLGTTSIYTIIELFAIGMDPAVSLRARIVTLIVAFGGLGFAFVQLRQLSRRFFGMTDEQASNRAIAIHDALYPVVFNGVTAPVLYLLAGASQRDLLWGTGAAMVVALVTGPINGFFIDLSGELSGLRPSPRMPARLRSLEARSKRWLFVGIVLGFTVAVALPYWSQLAASGKVIVSIAD